MGCGFLSLAFTPMQLCLCWVPAIVSPQPHLGMESALSER